MASSSTPSSPMPAPAPVPLPESSSSSHLSLPSSSSSSLLSPSPEPECTMVENECYCWYFAIGSMINHVSLSLRELHPIKCSPAKLSGWRIVFDGAGGMANVMEDAAASFHGVLHLLSRRDMLELDKIEATYYRVPVTAQLYDGSRQRCFVYKMDESKIDRRQPASLPSERYLDIITRGCEHYGVDKSYINWLKCHPCIPRKKAEDFKSLPLPDDVWKHTYTLDELQKCDGKDGRAACFAVCGKVFRWNFSTEETEKKLDSLLTPGQLTWYRWHVSNSLGRDVSLRITHFLYEPRYPIARTIEEMTEEQMKWVEDMNYERMLAKASDGRLCWLMDGVMDYFIKGGKTNGNPDLSSLDGTPLSNFEKSPPTPFTPPINTASSD